MQRAVLDGVLSTEACQELLLLARSLAVLGYRDYVSSCTIFEVATALPAALIPLVAARQAVRAAVEEALDVPLLIEFTGLICWRPGGVIGWHHDANRPYLLQRSHSAVCYLQHAGTDFQGGTFQFQDGGSGGGAGPVDVPAVPGRVVAYGAQDVHGVTPVAGGERFALTLWFTSDPAHSEDARLLGQMAGPMQRSLGLPATMWRLPGGTDLRLCRLAMAGLGLVHRGRLLHSAEGVEDSGEGEGAAPLQLAVQPAVLQAWLDWHQQQAMVAGASGGVAAAAAAATSSLQLQSSSGSSTHAAADAAPPAAAAELVGGVQFGSVQEAILSLQRWCRRRCPDGWGRERVCCTHLCQSPAGQQQQQQQQPSCAWLRSCQLGSGSGSAGLQELGAEVQEAVAASSEWLKQQGAALQALWPEWQQLSALFVEEQ